MAIACKASPLSQISGVRACVVLTPGSISPLRATEMDADPKLIYLQSGSYRPHLKRNPAEPSIGTPDTPIECFGVHLIPFHAVITRTRKAAFMRARVISARTDDCSDRLARVQSCRIRGAEPTAAGCLHFSNDAASSWLTLEPGATFIESADSPKRRHSPSPSLANCAARIRSQRMIGPRTMSGPLLRAGVLPCEGPSSSTGTPPFPRSNHRMWRQQSRSAVRPSTGNGQPPTG